MFEFGTAWQVLEYAASGSSLDWVSQAYPGVYAYTLELRPPFSTRSIQGFVLPTEDIIPSGEEYMNSLKAMAREMH